MKTIETGGIIYIDLVPSGTEEWYYGISYEHGDLYEAEEVFRAGHPVEGRDLCLIHYPDGEIFRPVPKAAGSYSESPVYYNGKIYILNVEFGKSLIQIIEFDCSSRSTEILTELPLAMVKDCYNLRLDAAPLTLSRQCVGSNEFEIIWPEKVRMEMGDHDSFFLRDGDKLYFSRWHEEGEDTDYKYWEETVVRNLSGEEIDVFPGDVRIMPNGETWYLK